MVTSTLQGSLEPSNCIQMHGLETQIGRADLGIILGLETRSVGAETCWEECQMGSVKVRILQFGSTRVGSMKYNELTADL